MQATITRYGWRPYTAHSIQDFDRLREELEQIREHGYAIDNEERRVGSICIGAPIRDYSRTVIAALSVSGTTQSLNLEQREKIIPRLLAAAGQISFRMGYSDQIVS